MQDGAPRDPYGRPLPRGSRNALAGAEQPGTVVRSAEEACRRAIALFDDRRFFEAHEFFERKREYDPDELFQNQFYIRYGEPGRPRVSALK